MTTTVEVQGRPIDFDTQYNVCYTLIYPNGTRVRHAVRGPNTPQGLVGSLRGLADHLENYLQEREITCCEPAVKTNWGDYLRLNAGLVQIVKIPAESAPDPLPDPMDLVRRMCR